MFAIVDIETGEILRTTHLADGAQTNSSHGTFVTDDECSDEEHYFVFGENGPERKDRPRLIEAEEVFIAADGVDAVEIESIPAGATIWIRDNLSSSKELYQFSEADGFVFCTAEPCDVTVEIAVPSSAFPYRNQRVRIVAHD